MPKVAHAAPPPVMIVEPDDAARAGLEAGLTADGMVVATFATEAAALTALDDGAAPAVLVTPATPGAEDALLVTRSRAKWPRLAIVFTGPRQSPINLPGAYHLATSSDAAKLSRFLRLVVARPALRSTLQSRYRDARRTSRLASRLEVSE